MTPDRRRLVFERDDDLAVLFNVDTRSVVLVEQFRVPGLNWLSSFGGINRGHEVVALQAQASH